MERESIKKIIFEMISFTSGINEREIQESMELKKGPLDFDDMSLSNLAIELSKLIQKTNPRNSIVSSEIQKKKFTVGKLIDIVHSRA